MPANEHLLSLPLWGVDIIPDQEVGARVFKCLLKSTL